MKAQIHILAMILYLALHFECQITLAAELAFNQRRLMRSQLCPCLENGDCATVTYALMISKLDFCNALFEGMIAKMVQQHQLYKTLQHNCCLVCGREHP